MANNVKTTSETKKAVRFFCITMAVLLLSSIFIWGFQCGWGSVRVKRLTITGDDGSTVSSLVYVPKTATNEHPAQAIMIFHGRSNQGHSNDTWSLELARRGYVVFSPDLSGGGESDVTDRQAQAIALTKYVTTLNYIDADNITVVGYSAGCMTCAFVADALPGNVRNIVEVMAPSVFMAPATEDETTGEPRTYNFCIIKGQADQYNFEFVGDLEGCREFITKEFSLPEMVEYGKDYDSFRGTLRYEMATDFALHQTANISSEAVQALVRYITYINPNDVNTVADGAMVWGWQQLFSGVACVTMMFALAAFLNLLMQTKFFGTMAFPRVPRKELRGAKNWALDILFSFVIPVLAFIPVSAYGMAWFANSKLLPSTNLNGIMVWLLLAMGLVGVIRMIGKANGRKKAGETIVPSDYCIAAEGEKFNWANVGKALILGVIAACFFGLWMTAMEGYFGISYQIWNLSTYLKPSPTRVLKAIPYMLIIFTVMFLGNVNQRVLPSTGNERKDMWIAVTVNTVLTASALFVLLFIQYGGNLATGTGEAVFKQMTLPGVRGTSVGALDFAFGYCYMMGGTTGVVTYIYRKHGNVLPAVIPSAIFCGLFTLAAFTLVR